MRPPNTVPIPTPAPAKPMVARPAPWIFAAAIMAAAVDSATIPRDCMTLRPRLRVMAVRAELLKRRPLRETWTARGAIELWRRDAPAIEFVR